MGEVLGGAWSRGSGWVRCWGGGGLGVEGLGG